MNNDKPSKKNIQMKISTGALPIKSNTINDELMSQSLHTNLNLPSSKFVLQVSLPYFNVIFLIRFTPVDYFQWIRGFARELQLGLEGQLDR